MASLRRFRLSARDSFHNIVVGIVDVQYYAAANNLHSRKRAISESEAWICPLRAPSSSSTRGQIGEHRIELDTSTPYIDRIQLDSPIPIREGSS